LGLRAKAGGGYEVVSRTGRYLSVTSSTAEDAAVKAIVDPYVAALSAYNATSIGKTTAPIDTMAAFTQETNGANLQADASVYELSVKHSIPVDFHLSGAMTNKLIATSATPVNPYNLTIADMFAAMPYENSLLVLSMNGPQLKTVLERAYRNYYYYKYVPGYGGYSYYTTCMIDTNAIGKITYNDLYPALPNGNNVVALTINGVDIDFTNASKYYNVSTVNYLAAGSCNFNDAGKTLWPLDQIVADTQYYVRDAVIDYVTYKGTVSPAIDGRLNFITDTSGPVITITSPVVNDYLHTDSLTFNFGATDTPAGVKKIEATFDGMPVTNGQVLDLFILALGEHTFTVNAWDKAGNQSTQSVKINVIATIQTLKLSLTRLYNEGKIDSKDVYQGLMDKLVAAEKSKNVGTTLNQLNAFINQLNAQNGKHITTNAADLLLKDVQWVIAHLK
jgi:hypothetical protein